jgi:hypothetical protein
MMSAGNRTAPKKPSKPCLAQGGQRSRVRGPPRAGRPALFSAKPSRTAEPDPSNPVPRLVEILQFIGKCKRDAEHEWTARIECDGPA